MLNTAAKPFVKLVERYLPDPYIFVLLLTLVVFAAAMLFEQQSPLAVVTQWGDGFWGLLSFSMQMLLVLVAGYMLASTPLVTGLLNRLAALAKSPGQAIILVTLISLLASWLNWGFGLVVGALFAKALARQIKVDYRLLVASAYSGFIVWHGGLAGSVPLTIATPGHFSENLIGLIPTTDTIFASFNLLLLAILFIAVPLVNRLMLPKAADSIYVDPAKLQDQPAPAGSNERPADKQKQYAAGIVSGICRYRLSGAVFCQRRQFKPEYRQLFVYLSGHLTTRHAAAVTAQPATGDPGWCRYCDPIPVLCRHYGSNDSIRAGAEYVGVVCQFRQCPEFTVLEFYQCRYRQYLCTVRWRPMGGAGTGNAACGIRAGRRCQSGRDGRGLG